MVHRECGTTPVKDSYLVFMNTVGKIVDKNGFIIPSGTELDKALRDIIISSASDPKHLEEDECSCGSYCMFCLGMSWSDFM